MKLNAAEGNQSKLSENLWYFSKKRYRKPYRYWVTFGVTKKHPLVQ